MIQGFLVIDKPGGMTSNAVVGNVRRVTGVRKVGHAGTLDPMATGALVVGIGPVTRLIRFIQDQPKEYVATAVFGVSTDTLDADGAILAREPMEVSVSELERVLERFRGEIHQVPPMFSALKKEGRRLYDLARLGVDVDREPRSVRIYEIELLEVGSGPYPDVAFRVVCSKGTYVRTLAADIAGAMGGGAHLSALRRLRVGSLSVEDHGVAMEALEDWKSALLTPSQALADLPAVVVGGEAATAVSHGVRFVGGELAAAPPDLPFRVLGSDGALLAVYQRSGQSARPEVVMPR